MSRRLRPVPETPERALALIRVSKEREGMVSPELQDTAINDYAAGTGRRVVHRMEGLDESGSRAKSRWWARLDEAVGMVERGEIDVILVWKFSRTSRNRLRWAIALDRVEAAGGRLESATEQVDTTTSTGRFTRGMLGELAAFEAERIGEQWKETHARRRSLGLPHNGGYRPGYRYQDKTYEPDPDTAPLVAEAYQRYVDGQGLRRIADWLNAVGVGPRVGGTRWTHRGVASHLDTGWAAGLLHVHDPACTCRNPADCARRVHVPGAHQPIIDQALWNAFLAERRRRASTPRRQLRPTTPLAGLVRCGSCGYGMRAATGGVAPGHMYRCDHPGCPAPTSTTRARAEDAAKAWLAGYAHEVERAAELAAAERAAKTTARSAVTRLARAVTGLDEELTRLTREYSRGVIPEIAYTAARDELLAERAAAARELEQATARVDAPRPSPTVAAGALADWDVLPAATLAAVLRQLLRVVIERGSWRPTARVVPAWEWPPS